VVCYEQVCFEREPSVIEQLAYKNKAFIIVLKEDCFDTSVDESLEDFKRDTQQRYRTSAIRVPQWFLWLRDRN